MIVIVTLVGGGAYWYMTQNGMLPPTMEANADAGRVTPSEGGSAGTDGKLKAANFSGTLEEVNTGCFADGECYVVVDGKHITTLMGWSQDTVGSVLNADSSISDLGVFKASIGREAEVYAQDKGDGTYTLYGNEGFYVKLK
jgi:hypothetical protein